MKRPQVIMQSTLKVPILSFGDTKLSTNEVKNFLHIANEKTCYSLSDRYNSLEVTEQQYFLHDCFACLFCLNNG